MDGLVILGAIYFQNLPRPPTLKLYFFKRMLVYWAIATLMYFPQTQQHDGFRAGVTLDFNQICTACFFVRIVFGRTNAKWSNLNLI